MIKGEEFHSIIENIFDDVKGLKVSSQLQVNCPLCQEREGLLYPDNKYNLEINTAKRVFKCWKCDEPSFSGSLGKLIRQFGTRLDYETYKSYASAYPNDFSGNGENEEDDDYEVLRLPDEMIPFSQMESGNLSHFEAYNYMINDRKVCRDIILKYRLGFCVRGEYMNRVVVPSYDINGNLNYFVTRSYDPSEKKRKYMNPKIDKDKIIFNEGYINWDSTVFLVEGVFDMFSVPNAIPLLGKTLSTALFNKLKILKPNVVILLDPDAYKNSINIYHILRNIYEDCGDRIKIVKLPTNDDVDELRKNMGIGEVINSIYTARGLTVEDHFAQKLHKAYNGMNEKFRGQRPNSMHIRR